MNKRILYISYDGMTDPLGQSQVLPYLCGLSKYGFQFDLISFEKKDKFEKQKRTIELICESSGITWHPLTYTKNPPVLSTLFDLYRMQRKTSELHEKIGFSGVHCRSYLPGIIGRFFKLKNKVPFIFDMRGFWVDERVEGGIWNLKNPIFYFIYHFLKRIEKKLFKDATQIISLTEAAIPAINKIRSASVPSIEVIPCCVDDVHFNYQSINDSTTSSIKSNLGFSNDDFILTYLGSVSTWYMPDRMLDFFKVLKSKKSNAKFLFITQEDSLPILKLAEEKNILSNDLYFTSSTRMD